MTQNFKLYTDNIDYTNYTICPPPKPIGYLIHKPTMSNIMVYHKINWFHKLMFKLCFGLKYVDSKNENIIKN